MTRRTRKPTLPGGVVWKGPDALAPLLRPLTEITPNGSNPNRHDDADIAAKMDALDTYGQQIPFVIRDDGVLLAGEGRTAAARELGWTHVAVVPSDLEGWKRDGFMVSDNETGRRSSLDPEAAARVIQAVTEAGGDAHLMGITDTAIAAISKALVPGGDRVRSADDEQLMTVSLRVNRAEHRRLRAASESAGLSMAAWARSRLLG